MSVFMFWIRIGNFKRIDDFVALSCTVLHELGVTVDILRRYLCQKSDRNKLGSLFPVYWILRSQFFWSMWHCGRSLKSSDFVLWEGEMPRVFFFGLSKLTLCQGFQSPNIGLLRQSHEIFTKNKISEILKKTHRFGCSWTTGWRWPPLVKSSWLLLKVDQKLPGICSQFHRVGSVHL